MGGKDIIIAAFESLVDGGAYADFYRNGGKTDFIKEKRAKGEYPYIPLDINLFEQRLEIAINLLPNNIKETRFIDIGCGIGTKLLVASTNCRHVTGIEISPSYVTTAKALIRAHCSRTCNALTECGRFDVIEEDAFKHDYKPYHILYFYCPLLDYPKECLLEQYIVESAKKGALFLPNNPQNQNLWQSKQVKAIYKNWIYRKV